MKSLGRQQAVLTLQSHCIGKKIMGFVTEKIPVICFSGPFQQNVQWKHLFNEDMNDLS